jgi:hypothetical protein
MATVALFTAMMGRCRRGTEGGDYTIQASLVVISTGAAHAASGALADTLGFATHFELAAIVAAFVASIAWAVYPRTTSGVAV